MPTTTVQQRKNSARTKILEAFDRLSDEDQVCLVRELQDRLTESNGSFKLTKAQEADLARRVAKYRAGKAVMHPWEDVKARLDARVRSYRSKLKTKPKRT